MYCTVPSILRSYLSIAWCFHAIQVGSSYPVFRHLYLHSAALRANTDVFIQDNFSPTCIAFKHHAIHTNIRDIEPYFAIVKYSQFFSSSDTESTEERASELVFVNISVPTTREETKWSGPRV